MHRASIRAWNVVALALVALLFLDAGAAAAAAAPLGDLPRKGGKPLEAIQGVATEYGSFKTRDGLRLRTIVTKPANATGKLPAILFVQWLSCDTVEVRPNPRDGWGQMMHDLVARSGVLIWRTEKRGVGDSDGDCATMDYDTELGDHRQALEELRKRPDVDPRRIVIYGASIGSTYAPLLAADQDLAGVAIWGGGTTTWFERMLRFERNALELGGSEPATFNAEITARAKFFERYLLRGESPTAIVKSDPAMAEVWKHIVGTDANSHYGRPFAFHQQAQRANWAGAWSRVRAPVLALYGQYDWYESRDAAALIANIVNRKHPGTASFQIIPGLDHHFSRYPTPEAAFQDSGGRPDPKPVVDAILNWLGKVHVRSQQ